MHHLVGGRGKAGRGGAEAVLDLAGLLEIEVLERDMGLFDIYTADEVFVTGTAAEVAPVTRVDGRIVGSGKPGPITRKLMGAFSEMTKTTGTPISK